MAIWDTRYEDERWGLETKASFNYFQQYLKQDYPRTIKQLHDDIKSKILQENQLKNQKKKVIKIETLYNYSLKWKWKRRERLYDEHLKNLHFSMKEKEVMDWESEQLKLAKQRSNFHNDTLQNIHNASNDEMSLQEKVFAEGRNQDSYNRSIDGIYKILYGGVTQHENYNEHKGEFDVNSRVVKSIEELNQENEDYFKELEKEMDRDMEEE